MKLPLTGSQTVGPYYHFGLAQPDWADLTRHGARGEKIRIEGRILDGDRKPCHDAFLEVWQANADGRYNHPEDRQDKKLDPKFIGFGRVFTDAKGRYAFTTIRPGAVPGRGNAMQAPHIAVTVFARGLLKHLATRIYFPDRAEANEADPVLGLIDDPGQRATLIARPAKPTRVRRELLPTFRFDVILQGEGETAFLEI
jgi:protocatechuate 3,4-dioxygenase alpha subunit